MECIQDYRVYTARMKNGMDEKLFFTDKIPEDDIDAIIDFGCADGELLVHLHALLPHCRLIGYDIDSKMLDMARERAPFGEFYDNWKDIRVEPGRTALNLSSVVHEVYAYCYADEIAMFWERVFNSGFAYVFIRDMALGAENPPVDSDWKRKVIDGGYGKELADFERHWGEIRYRRDMIHFLLKYRYRENWEREVQENYLPLSAGALAGKVRGYDVIYLDHSPLPFLVDKVQRDLGLDIQDIPTHVKMLCKKH